MSSSTATSREAFGPPRPYAVATVFGSGTSDAPSASAASAASTSLQTLLYSIRVHISKKSTNKAGNSYDVPTSSSYSSSYRFDYPPEIIVLVPQSQSKTKNVDVHKLPFLQYLCTRIIPIPIDNSMQAHSYSKTNLVTNLFRQLVYSRILYIDQCCLVQRDITHILSRQQQGSSHSGDYEQTGMSVGLNLNYLEHMDLGLITAAPMIHKEEQFDTAVMLLQPSLQIFHDLNAKLISNADDDADWNQDRVLESTFNTYFQNTWTDHLSNGQKFNREYNYCIHHPVHVDSSSSSSNNKDCRKLESSSSSSSLNHSHIYIWNTNNNNSNNSNKQDLRFLEQTNEYYQKLYQRLYKKSQIYIETQKEDEQQKQNAQLEAKQKQQKLLKQQQQQSNYNHNTTANTKTKQMEKHHLVSKKYKQLRKEGKNPKEAMILARQEYGMDKDDAMQQSPSSQVASMFGMGHVI